MIATDDFDDRAGPAATTGMMTPSRCPSGSRQYAHHRVDYLRSVDNAKTGTMPARAETLTGASSGSTASNRADGPDRCLPARGRMIIDMRME